MYRSIIKTTYVRYVDSSDLVSSLSSDQHSEIEFIFNSHFIDSYQTNLTSSLSPFLWLTNSLTFPHNTQSEDSPGGP
jgi:hypothetical protein